MPARLAKLIHLAECKSNCTCSLQRVYDAAHTSSPADRIRDDSGNDESPLSFDSSTVSPFIWIVAGKKTFCAKIYEFIAHVFRALVATGKVASAEAIGLI
eukprot:IDg9638t1